MGRQRSRSGSRLDFPVVGVGASAGGLEALQKLFGALPDETGMAFVVVVHLSPEHQSHMAELIARTTALPVSEVTEDTPVEPDHVYVIMPDQALTFEDGSLRVNPAGERPRHPIDTLFGSMAEALGERAVGVVLSGSGSNGAAGIRRIKERGGAVFVQDPETAGQAGMPRVSIATGAVDGVFAPEDIPQQLLAFATHPYLKRTDQVGARRDPAQAQLESIFALISARRGHDFSGYKPQTMTRRIHRRMGLRHLEHLEDYVRLVRDDPDELQALVRDLLINITAFFRDPEAWAALETQVIVPLVRERAAGQPIRTWVPACATGEEAYSLAMLLIKNMASGTQNEIKVFATDAAPEVLARARAGLFPGSVAEEMPEELLLRFFDKEDDFYRARKDLREAVVFAPHNLLADPPFSHLDLVSCRNLLIYLEPATQQRVLSLLHFALREDGHLFLGTAENVGHEERLFETVSKKWRIFRRLGPTRHDLVSFRVPGQAAPPRRSAGSPGRSTAEQAHAALLTQFAPPSVLIDEEFRIHFFHGDTDPFLQQPRGVPTLDLLRIARRGFAARLQTAVARALLEQRPVTLDAAVEAGSGHPSTRIRVAPLEGVRSDDPVHLLVSFLAPADAPAAAGPDAAPERRAEPGPGSELEDALRASREEARATLERLEASNEELRASNEEIASINEELRSSNEELETSKEELQSLNEELNTVNAQLQSKVEELEDRTNDLDNLLRSSAIATIALDRSLQIRWFTPAVSELLDIIQGDIGRPLAHFARKFADGDLIEHAQAVLRTLTPGESEVMSDSGMWFMRRILPYRTSDDRIDGVVVTFTDITQRKQAEMSLRESEERFRALVEASAQAVWSADAEGAVVEDSPSWRAFTGQSVERLTGSGWLDAVHPDDRDEATRRWREAVARREPLSTEFRLWHAESGEWRPTQVRALPLAGRDGAPRGWVGMNTDVSERRRSEAHQQALIDELQHRVKNLFANINALLAFSRRGSAGVDDFVQRFQDRMAALERTQTLFSKSQDSGFELREMVMSELEAHGANVAEKVRLKGARVRVDRRTGEALAMAIHELATNAVKHGALAHPAGQIHVDWAVLGEEAPSLVFRWRESGVQMDGGDRPKGFGSELIEQAVPYMVGGTSRLEFMEDGVRCAMELPLARTGAD